jgi:4-amino-4-deoxy-L-arabinose transferase-like glycosyltransferase
MVWLVSLFVFFSMSRSKMAHYALPMLPPLALLVGPSLARLWSEGWREETPHAVQRGGTGLAWLLIMIGVAVLLAPALSQDLDYSQVGAALLIAPLGLGGLGLGVFLMRRRGWAAWASPLVALLALAGLAGLATPKLDDYRSLKPLVAPIASTLVPEDVLVSFADYYHGLVFYSGRRVVVARNWGELDFGRRQDSQAAKWFLPDDTAFIRLLQNPRLRVVAVGETQAFLRLKEQAQGVPGLLLFEWECRGDKSLFSNRPR